MDIEGDNLFFDELLQKYTPDSTIPVTQVNAKEDVAEGETATEKDILDFCGDKLAKYKIPRQVEFRDELPKSAIGKILRRVLVEEEKNRKKA